MGRTNARIRNAGVAAWRRVRALVLSGHHLHRRGTELSLLLLAVIALQAAAGVGMAYVAGFSSVAAVLPRISWPWIGALAGGIVLSFIGYFYAYRGIYEVAGGHRLDNRKMVAVVGGGFGGFLTHGGAALDKYALRAAGANERDASVRVSVLAGMEHGVLAVLATGAGIAVLALGRSQPPADFVIPWSVLPIPGFALAFWLAGRYRQRLRNRIGWRRRMAVFLDSIELNRRLFLRPRRHGVAVSTMAVFWLADAFAMWAALVAFGFEMNPAAMFIGYATGMVFTRRTGPLGGAGILTVVLPVTIWYSGAPFAVAVVAVFAYRVLSMWMPMPLALASLPTLRRMAESDVARADEEVPAGEPALEHKSS